MRRRGEHILCTFLCAVLLLSACGQRTRLMEQTDAIQSPRWQEQYNLGIRYLSDGNYEEAIIAFTAAIEIDPKQAPAYVGRGDAYVGLGKTEEELTSAQADYEKAIELDEAYVEAYLGLADVYVRQEDYEKAIKVLQSGLEKTNDNEIISNKISEIEDLWNIKDVPSEITVLTKQTITESTDEWGKYSAEEMSTTSYCLYQYDKQGYMIHHEGWSNNYNFEMRHREWIKTSSDYWTYNAQTNRWTENYERAYGQPKNGSIELLLPN